MFTAWARYGCVLAVVAACGTEVLAWEAIRWNGGSSGWTYDEQQKRIEITAPGTYKFYATNGGANGTLDEIVDVAVDANVAPGAVIVSVVRDPATGGGPGCTTLGGIDLTSASASEIVECRVLNNAATMSPIRADKLTTVLNVGGAVTNDVTFNTLNGDIYCASLGDLTATTGNQRPEIVVTGNYAGDMTLNGSLGVEKIQLGGLSGTVTCQPAVLDGGITINGDVSGTLHVTGASRPCVVNGNVTSTGILRWVDNVRSVTVTGEMSGLIDIQKDLKGTPPLLLCESDVAGGISINGGAQFVFGSVASLTKGSPRGS